MKYGLLKYSTGNIGDEIQSLAARQFIPSVDYYFDRDQLNTIDVKEPTKVIMNGWFLQKPQNWPPSSFIFPKFISFHITHKNECLKYFSSRKSIEYLKRHEPIGCRDYWTLNFLDSLGVKTYFSGCLTLTLRKNEIKRNNEILIVEPFNQLYLRNHSELIKEFVPDKIRSHLEFITHWDPYTIKDYQTRFLFAEKLLQKYQSAKLVITSRLHCALPCLAYGTPVYFIDIGYCSTEERNRFDGLIGHLDTIKIDNTMFNPLIKYGVKYFQIEYFKKILSRDVFKKIDWEKNVNLNDKTKLLRANICGSIESFIKN